MRTLKDAIYGLAVGDALGLPVQFKCRDTYKIDDMVGYGAFHMPEGSWSDDTSMAIATCDSIKRTGKVDVADIRKCFEDWYYRGVYTPFGEAYDIGSTCADAITGKRGLSNERSNGNGSLMRIIPLAFVSEITREQVAAVSAITHAHERSIEGCVAYIEIAKGLMAGRDLKACIREAVSPDSVYARARNIEGFSRDEIKSTGYVVDTFEAAMWCMLTTDSYADCMLKAVNLGDDTDTVGAVAGGLAGILYGLEAIPAGWLDKLQSKEWIEKCLF